MSGLFLRLACQAIGQVHNPVRAALPSRYQADLSAASGDPAVAASGPTPDTPTGDSLTALEAPPHGMATVPEPAGSAPCSVASGVTPGRMQQQPALPLDGLQVDPPPVMIPQKRAGTPRQVAQRIVEAPVPSAIAATGDATGDTTGDVAGDYDLHRVSDDQSLAVATTIENAVPATQPETSVPEPLLASPATAVAINPSSIEQIPAAESVAPNEVHVHIGRIEVTALAPAAAAAPKARRSTTRQPMSLDDYLARRRQRS